MRGKELGHLGAPEKFGGQEREPSLGFVPGINGHRPAGMVDQQGPVARTHHREPLGRHTDPAVPILAAHQLARFIEAVPKEKLALYIDP